jgi:nucleolar pre-ribosomal-associated protein 1
VSSNPHLLLCIVRLLHTLFNLHPTNTCQITQLEPLLKIYHGTLTEADLLIFSIFQLFEIHRKLSLSSLFNRWSFSSEIACSSALESLQSLDSAMVFRTTLYYPKWRKLHAEPLVRPGNNHNSQLYDPIFLLLLSHLVLSQHPPSTPFGWVNLFRTNVVGLCVRLLSSKDPALRNLGLSHLTAIYRSINVRLFLSLKNLFLLTLCRISFSKRRHTSSISSIFSRISLHYPQPTIRLLVCRRMRLSYSLTLSVASSTLLTLSIP